MMSFLKKACVLRTGRADALSVVASSPTILRHKFLILGMFASALLIRPVVAQTPATLAIQVNSNYPCVVVSGVGSNACMVQFSTNLLAVNPWHYLTNFQGSTNPAMVYDVKSPAKSSAVYRAFTQQLPTNVTPITNMVWISPGTFTMGSPTNEALRGSDETQHQVTLTKGFFMAKFLVTQADYLALIGSNPSYFTTNQGYSNEMVRPVEEVSWNDATNYCGLLTAQEQSAGRLPTNWMYRLPTESEWEYACRAGTQTAFYFGSQLLSGMANFNGQYEYDATIGTIDDPSGVDLRQTTPVGSYEANPWGLYDMCGNLYQWCRDLYGPYPSGSVSDPQGATVGTDRVLRNNGWTSEGAYCRSAQRVSYAPTGAFANVGFRIVLAPAF